MAVTLTEYNTIRRLVAAGNNEIFYEDINVAAGTMVELVAANGDIDTSDNLTMFEGYEKVFVVNGTKLKIADFKNTRLTVTALTTAPSVGSLVTQSTSAAVMSVESVSADKTKIYGKTVTGTFVTTDGYTLSGGGMAPETQVPSAVAEASSTPLWYDWEIFPDGASGSLPDQAYLGCLWRGRMVLSGNPDDPHQWYMSRQADHTDFAYVAGDAQSPVAGGNADAGKMGDIVRALIPYNDDYLIMGCATSMHVFRGDPAAGGSRDALDRTVGVYGGRSWCFDGERNLYFWGPNGLYLMGADMGVIQNISSITLPQLIGDEAADPTTHRITMEFDRKAQGVVVCVTKLSDGTNSNYFISLIQQTTGIFPESYPEECGAYSLFYYDSNDKSFSGLLVGCKDGYIRVFDKDTKDDNTGASSDPIGSYVVYPLIKAGEDDKEGKLTALTVEVAGGASGGSEQDSDAVTWEVFGADDAETLIENIRDGDTAQASGTLTGGGRKNTLRPRVRGAYIALKFSNSTASQTFALNRVMAKVIETGKVRGV